MSSAAEQYAYDSTPLKGLELVKRLGGDVAVMRSAIVRDFVRSILIPPAIARLHDIGHGIATFETIGFGEHGPSIVHVEAPAVVQVAALKALIDIGLPRQLGLVDAGDQPMPGVIVLGGPQLAEAREIASHGAYMGTPVPTSNGNGTPLDPAMRARVDAGEFQVLEVEEDGSGQTERNPDALDPELPSEPTPEQIILQRRKGRNG